MILTIIFFCLFFVVINGDTNCSISNLCGTYGYCIDNPNGTTYCACKFWWEGSQCNQQSGSGKQVIILGCLAGTLILLFYGLRIGRSIYMKKKHPIPKKKEILQEPKFMNIAMERMKKSTQLSSCIVFVLMILVAIAALLIKWSLIKPIHNQVVQKFINQEQIFYNVPAVCNTLGLRSSNVISFSVACFIVAICVVISKRISLLRNTCHGYIAPAIPIDFISHVDRKFAAVIFAIIADELLKIVKQTIDDRASTDTNKGIIIQFLLRLLDVLIMGIRFYPILACVHINTIFTLSCATIYAWLDYAFTIFTQGYCYPDYYPTYDDAVADVNSIDMALAYYGTGSNMLSIQLCTDIPRFLCLAYVSVKLPVMLVTKIYERSKKKPSDEKKMLMKLTQEEDDLLRISDPNSVEMLYLQNLLRSPDQRPRSHALFTRIVPTFIYEWRDDFRFSSRVLCIYSSTLLLLFFVIIRVCVKLVPVLNASRETIQTVVDSLMLFINLANDKSTGDDSPSEDVSFPVPALVRPFLFAVAMTTTIIVVQLFILLANIRRNLLQAYRGDDSEIPRRLRSDYVSYATGNLHFAGYFIGYLIWGFIIIAVFSGIICFCIQAFISFGTVKILETILKGIIPSILLVLFKLFLNKLLAQHLFLQHSGDVLAFDNRRLLMIFLYFNFFLDAFLGFVSSILRLIKSIIGGIFYMCRLDYSLLGRKLEWLDSGFTAYCGFIHTECTHRHPIMLVFVSHLYTQLKKGQYELLHISSNDLPKHEEDMIQAKKSKRYIKKWKLAAFLIRNPTVVFFRKSFLRQLPIEEVHALNDLDNNNRNNAQQLIANYAIRMSITQQTPVSITGSPMIMINRF